jgi:hypothetical protein
MKQNIEIILNELLLKQEPLCEDLPRLSDSHLSTKFSANFSG